MKYFLFPPDCTSTSFNLIRLWSDIAMFYCFNFLPNTLVWVLDDWRKQNVGIWLHGLDARWHFYLICFLDHCRKNRLVVFVSVPGHITPCQRCDVSRLLMWEPIDVSHLLVKALKSKSYWATALTKATSVSRQGDGMRFVSFVSALSHSMFRTVGIKVLLLLHSCCRGGPWGAQSGWTVKKRLTSQKMIWP